jgi:hypothetical protein
MFLSIDSHAEAGCCLLKAQKPNLEVCKKKAHLLVACGGRGAGVDVEQARILLQGQHEAVVDGCLVVAQLVLRALIAASDLPAQHSPKSSFSQPSNEVYRQIFPPCMSPQQPTEHVKCGVCPCHHAELRLHACHTSSPAAIPSPSCTSWKASPS